MDARPGVAVGTMLVEILGFAEVVGAQPASPSTIGNVPPPVLAGIAFVAVLVLGSVTRWIRPDLQNRAYRSSLDRPVVSLVYGGIAFLLLAFLGGIFVVQATQFAVLTGPITLVGMGLTGLLLLLIGSLGYAVAGTWVAGVIASHNPWQGIAVGAVIGAVPWLVLPPVVAAAVWFLGAATGVGGPMRSWLHADKGVPADAEI